MKEVTHLIRVQTRRWTAEEYEPKRRMHSGQVSRGKLLGGFKDINRLAEKEGAPTLVEAYEPIKGDPYYDRIYREPKNGGMVEVWCRAQPIAEVPGLTVDSLPWACDLFEATVAPPRAELKREVPTRTPEAQAKLF